MQKSGLELLRLQTMMVLWKQTRNWTIIDVEFENSALSVTVQSYRLLTHTLRLRGESPFPRGSRIARFSDDVPRLQRHAATAYLETHLVTPFDSQISENQQKLITSIPSFRELHALFLPRGIVKTQLVLPLKKWWFSSSLSLVCLLYILHIEAWVFNRVIQYWSMSENFM